MVVPVDEVPPVPFEVVPPIELLLVEAVPPAGDVLPLAVDVALLVLFPVPDEVLPPIFVVDGGSALDCPDGLQPIPATTTHWKARNLDVRDDAIGYLLSLLWKHLGRTDISSRPIALPHSRLRPVAWCR